MEAIKRSQFVLGRVEYLRTYYPPFRFLDLPVEIRVMIYEYCLTPPEGLLTLHPATRHAKCERSDEPLLGVKALHGRLAMGLFRTSHLIRAEVVMYRKFLFQSNQWHFAVQTRRDTDTEMLRIYARSIKLDISALCHLHLCLSTWDLTEKFGDEIRDREFHRTLGWPVHEAYINAMMLTWACKVNVASRIKSLKTFEVDLRGALCSHGCCNLTAEIILEPIGFRRWIHPSKSSSPAQPTWRHELPDQEYERVQKRMIKPLNPSRVQVRLYIDTNDIQVMDLVHEVGFTCQECPAPKPLVRSPTIGSWHRIKNAQAHG